MDGTTMEVTTVLLRDKIKAVIYAKLQKQLGTDEILNLMDAIRILDELEHPNYG